MVDDTTWSIRESPPQRDGVRVGTVYEIELTSYDLYKANGTSKPR